MAQQATVAGDFLIPLAYEHLTGDVSIHARAAAIVSGTDNDNWWKTKDVADVTPAWFQNNLFTKNFSIYFVSRRLRVPDQEHSLLSYRIAYANKTDASWMTQVMNGIGYYSCDAGGDWFVDLGSLHVKLPNPEELEDRRFVQTSSFAVLATIRSQLVDELSRFTAMSTSSDAEKQTLLAVASARSLP
jgi:hypothetical protein